ncbi:MAG: hypothetical protein DWC09_06870 [Candidatus Poseidoniales archaeon]|nr:MAG: hypothetical protein DWC09_06870 [Candidatus Poseidoniales archaeon]
MNRKLLVVAMVLLVLLGSTPLTQGNSGGKQNSSTGCSCHSQSGSTAATVSLTGHPAQYTPGSTYTLSISVSNGVSGSSGGFNLEVDKGTLSAGIGFAVNVNQAQNSATHSITGSSYRSWSVDWIAPSTGSGVTALTVAGLTADSSGNYNGDRWDTLSFQIPEAGAAPNSPPSVSNLMLGPNGATTTDTLVLTYTYSDPENDPESGTVIQWFKDGVEQTSLSGLTVSSSETAKGQEWSASVLPSDGSDVGEPVVSNVLTIANSAPTTSVPTLSPNQPTEDDTISFTSVTSDADADAVGYDVRWFLDGVLIPELNDVETLPAYATRDGDSWVVEIRANDSEDVSQWVSSQSVTIGSGQVNTPPSVNTVQLSPGPHFTTDDFTVSYIYADADGDAEVDVEIQWFLNNAAFAFAENSLLIPSSFTEKGQIWFAKVRVNDGTEWSSWISSNQISVQNTPPVTESVSLSHAEAYTTDEVSVQFTMSDIDGDEQSNSEITWWRNGTMKSSLTGLTTLPASSTLKGEVWTVQVKAGDGTALSSTSLTADVIILNSAPTAAVTLTENVTSLGPLNAVITSNDADNEEVQTSIQWYRNGFLDGTLMNLTSVPSSYLGPGQTWSVHVTPTDESHLDGATVVSSTTIVNTNPTAEITVKTESIWLGERVDLSASLSADIDGQIVSALWSWTDTDSMTGSASGTEISIFPTANTVVTLVVVDDMGGEDTSTTQLLVVQGPTVSDFTSTLDGRNVDLQWAWDGPEANFSILRNGISIGTTDELSFTDQPFFAGENTYAVQPVIGEEILIAGASAPQTVLVEISAQSTPGPSATGGLITGMMLLMFGLGIGVFTFLRRD